MCHIEHMKAITIRELHMKTGDWVRKASREEGIVVMDRRRPVAKIIPFSEGDMGRRFSERTFVKGFDQMKHRDADSGRFVSEDRDRG